MRSEYVDVEAVAKAYEVTEATVRSWCRKGVIKGVMRVGRQWRIPKRYASGDIEITLPSEVIRRKGSRE